MVIDEIDIHSGWTETLLEARRGIELELERVYEAEELYWQQRGGWILEGDANTQFFHQHANGRRRKNTIVAFDTEIGEVRSQEDIMSHVTSFYK